MKKHMWNRLWTIFFTVLFFTMTVLLSGCVGKDNSISTFLLSKIVINRMLPNVGDNEGFEAEELKVIEDKKTIKQLVAALEGSEKVEEDLGYARSEEVHYEIQLIYKKAEKMVFSLWIDEDSERAVFSSVGYFSLSEDATKLLRAMIFEQK